MFDHSCPKSRFRQVLSRLSGKSALERNLVFRPSRFPEGNWKPDALAFEDVWFRSADGTRLHGWYSPHPRPRAFVLFAHGISGNLTDRAEIVRVFHEKLDLSVLAFDYRGFGRSEGKPSEAGILADARAARGWLAEREGIDEHDVILLGRSLGGAVTIDLAARDGCRGLVLQNTFTTLAEAVSFHIPWFSVRRLLKSIMEARLDSLSKISQYKGPLLQSHGKEDSVVPFRLGQKLFSRARGPKRFISVPGDDHNQPATDEFCHAFDEFLSSLPPPRSHRD